MELHDQILSAIDVNVAILDTDGTIVYVSDSWTLFARANGASQTATGVGVNYLEVCRRSASVSDARSALTGILSVINGDSPQFQHTYRCDAPGERRLFTMTVKPLAPGLKGVLVAHHNNTAIESAQLLYGHLLDSVRAIVWRAELPGFRTTYASRQAVDILGYPAERWTSEPTWWIQRIHPDDREWVLRFTSKAVEDRRNHSYEYRMVAADGRVVWLRNIVNVLVEATEAREVVGVSVDITERVEAEQARQQLAGRLLSAQEEERRAIARELHDDIGQSVAFLNMVIQRVGQHIGAPDLMTDFVALSKIAAKIAQDLSRVAQGLHPALLDFYGLSEALRQLCDEFEQHQPASIHCKIDDLPNKIDRTVAVTFYRVTQEALRNVAKHAEAQSVTLELSSSHTEVRLSITDDGIGFDVASARRASGLGLASMNERMTLIGGTLEVTARPGGGTRILATAPVGEA